jgi:hypothetical protein
MHLRLTAILTILLIILTLAWVATLILGMTQNGPVANFEQALNLVSHRDALFTLTYINAALLTVVAIAWMAALYVGCRDAAPAWATIGAAFVPIYGTLNLFAYLSQVSLVPALVGLRTFAAYRQAADLALYLSIQQWNHSAVSFFNNLAYALLGIPSIIFAVILYRQYASRSLRTGAVLFALSGAASLLGILGILLDIPLLSNGSLAGGFLFLLALFPLALFFWNEDRRPSTTDH